jgi:hypothetical protein
MKRLIPVLLFICLAYSPVYALDIHASNSIGQDLGEYDPLGLYSLHLDGNSRSLYKGDELIWEIRTEQAGKEITKTTSYANSSLSFVQTYLDSLLTSEFDGSSQTYFTYGKDGKLQTVSQLENGELVSMQSFFYDGVSHQISGSRTISRGEGSYRYYGEGKDSHWIADISGESFEKITAYPNNLTVKETWQGENKLSPLQIVSGPDGSIELAEGDSVTTYNEKGLLVREKKPSLESNYQYNDQRVLTKETKTDGEGRLYITDYLNGKKVSQQVSNNKILEKVIVFNADNTRVETLYDKGVAYCDVTYASDGMRVLSLQYR